MFSGKTQFRQTYCLPKHATSAHNTKKKNPLIVFLSKGRENRM